MNEEYDTSQMVQHLNELAEFVSGSEDLQGERTEIRDFVLYWRTLIETAVATNIGWVELTRAGEDALTECYKSFENLCPGGIDYFLENPDECALNSFTRPRVRLRTEESD